MCENPFEGGGGYSIKEISSWTPDQVYFRLAEVSVIKAKSNGESRSMKALPLAAAQKSDIEGNIRGRDKDGNPMKAKVRGKSLARQLMEEEAEKAKANGT